MRAAELFEQAPEKGWIQTPISLDQAMKTIQAECKHAYQIFTETGLKAYRGTDSAHKYFLGKTGVDRQPMNSSVRFQQMTDDALIDYLGPNAAVRSNSIFVTGRGSQASGYGRLYVIFPKDTARFTWSPEYDDIVIDGKMWNWSKFESLTSLPAYQKFLDYLEEYPELRQSKELSSILNYFDTKTNYSEWWTHKFPEQLQKMPPQVWEAARKSGFADFLYFLSDLYNFKNIVKLYDIKLAKFDPDLFIKDFKPWDTNWKAALASGNEILVSGEYVAVDAVELVHLTHSVKRIN